MASIALMISGAVLNATAFIGGSYLAKYLGGSQTDAERVRHDKAIEKYQKDYAAYQEKRQRLLDWYNQQQNTEIKASHNFTDTDEAFKLYSQTHPDYSLKEPKFSDYYRPNDADPDPVNSSFTADIDEYDRVTVRMKRKGGKSYPLFKTDGQPNNKLPKTIKESLGPTAEEVIKVNESEITRRKEKVKELQSSRKEASTSQRENIDRNIALQRDQIDELERESEAIEERMSLRDRVKAIFKKYGFTAFAVLSAVAAVIGVIVSNLKSGLTKLGKGVGNGFKAIGKRLGEILPGMVGAIASFIFKTAGEAIGFLAKNSWLLIVAVVLYFVEQVKNNRKRK